MTNRIVMRATMVVPILGMMLVGGSAEAQLGNLLPDTFQTIERPSGGLHEEAHFEVTSESLQQLVLGINSALAIQLSTFPLGSPGGGLSYEFDPDTGGVVRASESLGSSFAARALTVGKGKWNYGVNYGTQSYDAIDGIDLANGELQIQMLHEDTSGDGTNLEFPFEGDIIRSEMKIGIDVDTLVGFLTYGINDAFDVSLAIPYVSIDMTATNDLTIDRLATGNEQQPIPTHAYGTRDNPLDSSRVSNSDSASGLGDILIRGKYRVSDAEGGGFAIGLDARLPTGDEDELLGTGGTQIKPMLIGSRRWGKVAPHFNLGYGFSSGGSDFTGDLPDELNLVLGLEIMAGKSATFSLDYLGRQLYDATSVMVGDSTFQFKDSVTGEIGSAVRPEAMATTDDLDLSLAVVGLRFNPAKSMVVSLNAIWAVGSDGLEDEDVAFTIGIDFSN